MEDEVKQQQNECPEGCCQGDEILCLSIPCPITVVLLGLQLQLELPCLRLTSPNQLTENQIKQLQELAAKMIGDLGSGATK